MREALVKPAPNAADDHDVKRGLGIVVNAFQALGEVGRVLIGILDDFRSFLLVMGPDLWADGVEVSTDEIGDLD